MKKVFYFFILGLLATSCHQRPQNNKKGFPYLMYELRNTEHCGYKIDLLGTIPVDQSLERLKRKDVNLWLKADEYAQMYDLLIYKPYGTVRDTFVVFFTDEEDNPCYFENLRLIHRRSVTIIEEGIRMSRSGSREENEN